MPGISEDCAGLMFILCRVWWCLVSLSFVVLWAFQNAPTVFAYIFPMRRARRCAGQDTEYGGHERPETMRLFQYELDVGRMAAGTVF